MLHTLYFPYNRDSRALGTRPHHEEEDLGYFTSKALGLDLNALLIDIPKLSVKPTSGTSRFYQALGASAKLAKEQLRVCAYQSINLVR
jgi:hypothetical protein